jgi:hypothetical protein
MVSAGKTPDAFTQQGNQNSGLLRMLKTVSQRGRREHGD